MEVGNHVVLRCSNRRIHVIQLHERAAAKLGRARKTLLAPLLGQPYGALFALRDDENLLVRVPEEEAALPVTDGEPLTTAADSPADFVSATTTFRDNRDLDDDQAHQHMDAEAILEIKRNGCDVQQLVSSLTANSSTFANKTHFAQDKYVERKSAKHLVFVRACKPTPCAVAEAYFLKNPEKVAHMRVDSISMAVTMAGLRAGSQVLVVEEMNGMLVGAVAERVLVPDSEGRVTGRVLSGFLGNSPPALGITKMMDFNLPIMCAITHFELRMVERHISDDEGALDEKPIQYTTGIVHMPEEETNLADSGGEPLQATDATSGSGSQENDGLQENKDGQPDLKRRKQNGDQAKVFGPEVALASTKRRRLAMRSARPLRKDVKFWIKGGSDALLISLSPDTRGSITDKIFYVVEELVPRLLPGGVLVVLCAYMQPLAELYSSLQSDVGLRLIKRVELMETHLHHHQILRGRTHPVMSDFASGGFLLTGIKLGDDSTAVSH